MSPAAQKFYNLLLAYYLTDNSVISKLKTYVTRTTKDKRRGRILDSLTVPEIDQELKEQFDKLSDEDLSLVIKIFDMRMAKKQLELSAEAKDFITTLKLQPYQKKIFEAFAAGGFVDGIS